MNRPARLFIIDHHRKTGHRLQIIFLVKKPEQGYFLIEKKPTFIF